MARKPVSRACRLGLLVALLVLLIAAMLLPGSAVAWFYSDSYALGRVLIWLEQSWFPFSRWFHVLMFAGLTVSAWGLFPALRGWQVAGILLGVGVAGELVQIPVPGRTASVSDLMDDVLGIAIGLAVAAVVEYCFRRYQQRKKIS